MVNVDVEYCGVCNFAMHCQMLRQFLLDAAPDVEVSCHQGRRGAFEVKIDDQLVHSKLSCLAFPQHQSVLLQVERARRGESVERVKEAPIKDCSIM
ncbi:migration and invasion enhancer 1 [Drosophila sulfurigaster albostrigata]|uniref:Migration and invasion enhancer 1 n=1 Tax=Drosophila albomicans TaxID=7291 RepID=A0A6P8XJ01_DROAB|nr:migration and invasion enhancer 1 [Drosophila albomicans]XP_051859490.1 migration and invasion enhancer 1 [Drosophila albomicans]XP_060664114.1 migration and invasion enhancer 1 [Drosophila nasuta]XP_062141195.1 migration and invasion enhancer 1 [Drosophila sulfurigaster albostrigata]